MSKFLYGVALPTKPDVSGGGGGSALVVRDEGSLVDAATSQLNFVGGQVTATSVGPGQVDVSISGLGALEVQDEGITVDAAAALLNFKGDAVVATSPLAGQVDLDINKPSKYEMALVPTVIDAADTFTIPVGFQYIVFNTFTVDGTLIIEGQLVDL